MRIALTALISALALAACSGPKQKEGEQQDKAQAAASGVPYEGNGPNERAGKAQDQIDKAHAEAVDAQADALKAQGKQARAAADAQAEQLEERAKQIRDAGDKQADDLKAKAEQIKKQQ